MLFFQFFDLGVDFHFFFVELGFFLNALIENVPELLQFVDAIDKTGQQFYFLLIVKRAAEVFRGQAGQFLDHASHNLRTLAKCMVIVATRSLGKQKSNNFRPVCFFVTY